MEWKLKWLRSHRPLAILLIIVTVTGVFGIYVVFGTDWLGGQLLVCPGCNPPEMLHVDHYTVQNNTANKPSMLTMWLFGYGPVGKSLQVQALYLENGPMKYSGCRWIPYNESSCLTPFAVQGVTVPSQSIVPVSIDTSSQGVNFASGQDYRFDVVTDKSWFGGLDVSYPPPGLVMTDYTISVDYGQSKATRLTLTLANMATTPVTLISLTLKDVTPYLNSTSDSFPMNNPTISQPLATAPATLDTFGSSFYFEHQHSYFLTILSSKGPNSTSTLNY